MRRAKGSTRVQQREVSDKLEGRSRREEEIGELELVKETEAHLDTLFRPGLFLLLHRRLKGIVNPGELPEIDRNLELVRCDRARESVVSGEDEVEGSEVVCFHEELKMREGVSFSRMRRGRRKVSELTLMRWQALKKGKVLMMEETTS